MGLQQPPWCWKPPLANLAPADDSTQSSIVPGGTPKAEDGPATGTGLEQCFGRHIGPSSRQPTNRTRPDWLSGLKKIGSYAASEPRPFGGGFVVS
jgi:hypothetical protein